MQPIFSSTATRLALIVALALLPLAVRAQTELPVQPPSVTVVAAELSPIQTRVIATGSLVARQEVMIFPRIGGYEIETLAVDVGDRVLAGQPLATLDDQTLQALLSQADANLAIARAAVRQAESQRVTARATARQANLALERTRTLNERGDSAQAVLDQAQATADSANAAIQSAEAAIVSAEAQVQQATAAQRIAELNLSWATILAPVDGIVARREARLGDLSSGAAPLFQLILGGLVELEAEVVETDLVALEPGNSAIVSVGGLGGRAGTVRLIEPLVNPATRLGRVRVAIDDQDGLRVGAFAQADIIASQREAVTVPNSAVMTAQGGSFVQMVVDGAVLATEVVPGAVFQGRREILSGLAVGDTVLLRAGAFFQTGDAVKPVAEVSP